MRSLEKPTRRRVLAASGTGLAVLVAGCSTEEEGDDSPAQDGETPTQENAPQEPEDNSSRGSGTETEGPEQREDDEGADGAGEGGPDADDETDPGTPEGDG